MKWYDYLKSTKQMTAGEDLADSIILYIFIAVMIWTLLFN